MHVFYCPSFSNGGTFLDENESSHCVKVLRLRTETKIHVLDGTGGLYVCKILETNPKKVTVEILESHQEFNKRDYYLQIAIAPTKQTERFENFIDKAIEIGVDRITPIRCNRSERKKLRMDRIQRVAQAALKQSLNTYMPQIDELTDLNSVLNENKTDEKYIATCREDNRIQLEKLNHKIDNALVLIGPEGDFDQDELVIAEKHGFKKIDLGNTRLRTETAGIAVCQIIKSINLMKQ